MHYRKPFSGDHRVTSTFGMRNGRMHGGVDFGTPQGTPILAVANGRVIHCLLDQFGGAYIDIAHDDGNFSRYLHLSRFDVKGNQNVKAGQQIGLSGGAKGTWGAGKSTGPHLHFEIHRGKLNNRVDPLPLITNNQDIMLKTRLAEALNAQRNQFDKPTFEALKNAINTDNADYILKFAGSEPRQWLAGMEKQNKTLASANATLQAENARIADEYKRYKEAVELENEFKPDFKPRSEQIKAFLGAVKNSLPTASAVLIGLGINQDTTTQIISLVGGGVTMLMAFYLEWDKTQYNKKEKENKK